MANELRASATQEEAGSQEVARLISEGKKVTAPELLRRIRARAECARQQILVTHGVVEWAVDMIRDARDE